MLQKIGATFRIQPLKNRALKRPGNKMHTVILELNCKPGMRPVLLEALAGSLGDTRAYKGCKLVETYVDADDENRVILYEKWDHRDSQGAYMQWRVETGMVEGMEPILAEPARVLHFLSHPA